MNARALLLLLCVCGWDVAGNGIGEAGAVALAKALESGQCKLESLNLEGESAQSRRSVALAGACVLFPVACFSPAGAVRAREGWQ